MLKLCHRVKTKENEKRNRPWQRSEKKIWNMKYKRCDWKLSKFLVKDLEVLDKPRPFKFEVQTFFVSEFEIVVDSWKFTMLLLYGLWDDWPIFMISASKEQLQSQLEYTQLNLDCHSWWISKMQSGHENTLKERYAIKFSFTIGKNATEKFQKECFRLLLDHLAWIENQFLSGIRDSRKVESLWGMMRGVGGVRKSIHQSWLAKRLGLGLLCWGFKGVHEEIQSEQASTLQIGSVAFPPEQCTSQ